MNPRYMVALKSCIRSYIGHEHFIIHDNEMKNKKIEKGRKIIHLPSEAVIQICALEGGMASGKPSVCFRIDLPDGRTVLAQTSARLFVMAAAAIIPA